MTLTEACELALEISGGRGGWVIAIGRFKMVADIEAADPWGISVSLAGGVSSPPGKVQTIWSRDEWIELCGPQLSEPQGASLRADPRDAETTDQKPGASAQPLTRPDSKHREQLTLF